MQLSSTVNYEIKIYVRFFFCLLSFLLSLLNKYSNMLLDADRDLLLIKAIALLVHLIFLIYLFATGISTIDWLLQRAFTRMDPTGVIP